MQTLKRKIFTVGHSTHPMGDFIEILKKYGVKRLIDIRKIPKSRHNPQFNKDNLSKKLKTAKIVYKPCLSLGGLRKPNKESVNNAWINSSFRGFADYMQTEEFKEALKGLVKESNETTVAIMCAEAVPWRCHRSLIADALSVLNIDVEHIISFNKSAKHKITTFAVVEGKKITYPAQ